MDYKKLKKGDIPVYGTGGYMLSVDKALSYDKDAIGIGRKGTIDKPYILKAPFWTVDTLFYCIPKDYSNLNFLYGIFQKINWKRKDESTGVPSLSKTNINSTVIAVPSIQEQNKIADFLFLINRRIEKQHQLVEALKSYKRGALNQVFSKVTQRVPLSEISEYYSSANTMASITQVENGEYPIYDASGIVALIDKYDFSNSYVAIIKDGSGVGRLQLCQSKSSIIGTLGAIFPKHCTVRYLLAVLQTIDFRQFTTGMAIPHIYYKDYKNCSIPFPPQEQRNKIEKISTAIDFMIDKESRILSLLQQQKTSLMQQLFI